MKLHELTPAAGATKPAYRKGRGAGSGNGKTAGRGHKLPFFRHHYNGINHCVARMSPLM